MNGTEPNTIKELFIYCQGKFDSIINDIVEIKLDLKESPDKIGKWVVRIFMAILAFGMLVIAYLMYKK